MGLGTSSKILICPLLCLLQPSLFYICICNWRLTRDLDFCFQLCRFVQLQSIVEVKLGDVLPVVVQKVTDKLRSYKISQPNIILANILAIMEWEKSTKSNSERSWSFLSSYWCCCMLAFFFKTFCETMIFHRKFNNCNLHQIFEEKHEDE